MLLRAVLLAAAVGILFSAAAFAFTQNLIGIFNSEGNQELADIAFCGLRLYFLGFCPAGINIVAAAFMGAVERGRESFAIAFARGVASILFFAFVLSFIWKMDGIWLAFPAAEVSTLLLTAGLGEDIKEGLYRQLKNEMKFKYSVIVQSVAQGYD